MPAPSAGPDTALLEAGGLRLDHDGTVATIILDRPDRRNAQTPLTWEALAAIGESLDEAVRIVVVRAAGPSFCAGMDRRMLTADGVPGSTSLFSMLQLDDDALADRIADFQRGFTWLRRTDRITIAAVHGHAVGSGFQLALACDLRVLADDAQLSMREPALGLVPDLGGTRPLVELVGYARALEICATSRWVDAAEAAETGLATAVVPGEELTATVRDLVDAVLSAPAEAIGATKQLLSGAFDRSYDQQLAAERVAQVGRLRALGRAAGATT